MSLAHKYNLLVIEDATQGMISGYKRKSLRTIGHVGSFSFHETKNYTIVGESGLLIINDEQFIERAEIIRKKGTNRTQFFRGAVDKYSWVALESSYLPSELNAAYLGGQLEHAEYINTDRLTSGDAYYEGFAEVQDHNFIKLPIIPEECTHNAHMFYLKVADLETRTNLLKYLKANDIYTVFHYVPLHSAPAGLKFSIFYREDKFTTEESEQLIRVPMYYGLNKDNIKKNYRNSL